MEVRTKKLFLLALLMMVVPLACSSVHNDLKQKREFILKHSLKFPDVPKEPDTSLLIRKRFFEVAKQARDDLEVALGSAPPVTVLPVNGKIKVRDVVRVLRKATGFDIVFPDNSYYDKEVGDEIACIGCSPIRVLRLLGNTLGGLEPVLEGNTISFKDRMILVYKLPLLGTKRTFSASIKSSNSGGQGNTVGGSAPSTSVEVSGKFSDEFFQGIVSSLEDFAGKRKVKISSNKAQGTITIDGNPHDVKEVAKYLETLVEDLRYQIEFAVSIFQVELYDQFRSGIEWNKVFKFLPRSLLVKGNFGMPTDVGYVMFQLVSSRSTNQLVYDFLRQYGKVRVVSKPIFYLQNGFSAFFSSGTDYPYVQTIESKRYGDLNEETVTPTMGVAHSGLYFTIKAKIVDYDTGAILVSFMPEISTIVDWKDFKFEGTEYQNPVIERQNFTTRAIVFSGNTLLIGGIRVYRHRSSRTGTGLGLLDTLAGKNQRDESYVELVVMITPRIVKSKYYVTKRYL